MQIDFQVTGMTCAACSARVEKVTGQIPGVTDVSVNLLAGTMQVNAENEQVISLIVEAVSKAGYGAKLPGKAEPTKDQTENKTVQKISTT